MEFTPYFKKNWHRIDLDQFKFIYAEGEKLLKVTVETANLITKKNNWIFGAFITIFLAIAGYWFAGYIIPTFDIAIGLVELNILIVIFLSLHTMSIYKINVPGAQPEKMLTDESFEPWKDFELAYKNMILSRCIDHNFSIKENRKYNEIRLKKLQRTIMSIYFIPASFILGYLMTFLLS